jgi:hypothetical protein
MLMLVMGFLLSGLQAQQPGDTIVVKVFKYGSTSRDSLIAFPSGSLTFEKVIMKYNMRCKNGLISTQSAPDQGCGEWDYSCNTFIVDSSRIEEVPSTHPEYIITGNSGNVFAYSHLPLHDYYRFRQIPVTLQSVVSENQYQVGSGTVPVPQALQTDLHSGKTQILLTAAELAAAGFTAGPVQGIMLQVTNTGGSAQFLRIGIQHTSHSTLMADSVVLSGFSDVFQQHVTFQPGSNRIQFHTPFVWDGVSNLLLQFTFTNTVPGNPVVLQGTATATTSMLTASENVSLDLASQALVTLNTSMLGTIGNELTVTFWSYGYPDQLPANTAILYGYSNNSGQRQLNIHLPWANGSVYFDCGYAGGYDRINKAASASEYKGQWNHWAFTKNAATGVMNIYLNGTLWHSGSGLTKSISILNLLLGNNYGQDANYKGKINQLTIWNKALTASEIGGLVHRVPDQNHPSWGNLVAWYKADEGTGNTLTDSRNNLTSNGIQMQWGFDRGEKLNTIFSESNLRPNIKLLRGSYLQDTMSIWAYDSVQRNPNVVKQFAITPAPPGTVQHDVVTLVSTFEKYAANPLNYFDGDADTLLYTVPVTPDDSIQITQLSYFRRYPWYNEIMSFVTPYGKGLDLGMEGKTWYFDVTDFTPLLKGNKRMMLTGGVWQEELDIDFWFIVGTPPRNVLEFNQLWQGYARAGQASIVSINNNTRFAPVQVPLLSAGQSFKVRSTITGHGNEGEFQQNGGPVYHYLSVNDTTADFTWLIHKECSFNPVYPQGGTWVYDRQGWCPGEYSLLKEFDITQLVTPGTSAVIDYNCSPPQNTSGAYNYLVANQLVTYGEFNHTLDAAILDIAAPSKQVVHSRRNPVCANPELVVRNTGATIITSLEIAYWLNQGTVKQSFVCPDTIQPMEKRSIIMPTGTLWNHDLLSSGNEFHAEIVKVNGMTDQYLFNNMYHSQFEMAARIPSRFIVEIRTNNYPSENFYEITDEAGNTVFSNPLPASNTVYRDTLQLNGCFRLKITDTGNDGLSWWANTSQGTGYARLKKTSGTPIVTFQPDFGGGFEYQFSTVDDTGISESPEELEIRLYPNPASGYFMVEGIDLRPEHFRLEDVSGKVFRVPVEAAGNTLKIETSALSPGVYRAILSTPASVRVFKVLVL